MLVLGFTAQAQQTDVVDQEQETLYLMYELRDTVAMELVRYENRYGITLAGHMFRPTDLDRSGQRPALVIGTPYGGVKEQGAGIYAMNMAERGYVAIAFDESFNGESGGFALTAAQVDQRIKAVATASMYDISSMTRYGLGYTLTDDQRSRMLDRLSRQRWTDFESGSPPMPRGGWPEGGPADSVPEGLPPVIAEFFEYYAMERGWHPNTRDNFTLTSAMSFMNIPLMSYIDSISPRPILFIMGENAHSRYYTEEAYEKAAEPRERIIVPGARHIDLYDRADMIPFEKLDSFFSENLK
jgi:fermentation-respiration switch protein FrsA (DUF1100 family)